MKSNEYYDEDNTENDNTTSDSAPNKVLHITFAEGLFEITSATSKVNRNLFQLANLVIESVQLFATNHEKFYAFHQLLFSLADIGLDRVELSGLVHVFGLELRDKYLNVALQERGELLVAGLLELLLTGEVIDQVLKVVQKLHSLAARECALGHTEQHDRGLLVHHAEECLVHGGQNDEVGAVRFAEDVVQHSLAFLRHARDFLGIAFYGLWDYFGKDSGFAAYAAVSDSCFILVIQVVLL